MESILEKLKNINENEKNVWKGWTLQEKKQLLEIYYIFSKKERHIYDLIYSFHGCDSWEDIFRDYDSTYYKNKAIGVEIAINEIIESQIEKEKN